MAVPIFDPAYRGNKTLAEMSTNAIYADGSNGFSYQSPRGKIQSVAKRVMLGGEILSIPSPCGSNCSYSIKMNGPSFQCEESSDPTIYATWEKLKGATVSMPACVNYLAFSSSSNNTLLGSNTTDKYFRFDINYPRIMYRSGRGVNITCVTFASEYSLDLSFVNNIQTIQSQIKTLNPLNGGVLNSVGLGEDLIGFNQTKVIPDNFPIKLMGGMDLASTYSQLNQLAIMQSLADYTLAGAISCYESMTFHIPRYSLAPSIQQKLTFLHSRSRPRTDRHAYSPKPVNPRGRHQVHSGSHTPPHGRASPQRDDLNSDPP